MPVGNDVLYRLQITWSLFSQTIMNQFHFRTKPTTPMTTIPTEISDLHDDISNHLIPSLQGVQSDQIQLLTSALYNLNGGVFSEDIRNYEGHFGTVPSVALPSFIAQVISWRTGFRGRRDHGRTYVSAVPQSAQDANFLTASHLTLLSNAASDILYQFGVDGRCRTCYMVVYSGKNGNGTTETLPRAITYNSEAGLPVTRFVADNVLYTQRHRLVGRGI